MKSSETLDASIQGFKDSAGVALAIRSEALSVLPIVAANLKKIPYSPESMRLLEQATRLVVAHHEARIATLDVLMLQSEIDLGHGKDPGNLSQLMYGVVCEQRLADWFSAAEDWQSRASVRAIVLAELDFPEAHEDRGARE
jgi:hypothetical protein